MDARRISVSRPSCTSRLSTERQVQLNAVGELRIAQLDDLGARRELLRLQLQDRLERQVPCPVLESCDSHGLRTVSERPVQIQHTLGQQCFVGQRDFYFTK